MQTASRIVEAERRWATPKMGLDTRVSRTLTLRQWSQLMAAAKLIARDLNETALATGPWWGSKKNRHYREQAADCAAELVRVLHELERQ